jgi:hypothetical protein
MFEDGFKQLHGVGGWLRHRLSVTFLSDLGYQEPGIDGGGARRTPRRAPSLILPATHVSRMGPGSTGVTKEFMNGSVWVKGEGGVAGMRSAVCVPWA